MKHLLYLCMITCLTLSCSDKNRPLKILFWNTENFFHPSRDRSIDDKAYTPMNYPGYTAAAYTVKCENIAHILNMAHADLIGLAEIENRRVLEDLRKKFLFSRDWEILHQDSPDPRGIDVALLYRKSRCTLLSAEYIPAQSLPFPTRDILHADFQYAEKIISCFVVHAPSRYNRGKDGDTMRVCLAKQIVRYMDNRSGKADLLILTGDFNDEKSDSSLKLICSYPFRNQLTLLTDSTISRPATYFYQDRWICYDHMLIFARESETSVEVHSHPLRYPALLRSDPEDQGIDRFYERFRFRGGYSDHLPVISRLTFTATGS